MRREFTFWCHVEYSFLKNGQAFISIPLFRTLVTLLSLSPRLEIDFLKPLNLFLAMQLPLPNGTFKNEMQAKTTKMLGHWNLSSLALHPPGTMRTSLDGICSRMRNHTGERPQESHSSQMLLLTNGMCEQV